MFIPRHACVISTLARRVLDYVLAIAQNGVVGNHPRLVIAGYCVKKRTSTASTLAREGNQHGRGRVLSCGIVLTSLFILLDYLLRDYSVNNTPVRARAAVLGELCPCSPLSCLLFHLALNSGRAGRTLENAQNNLLLSCSRAGVLACCRPCAVHSFHVSCWPILRAGRIHAPCWP
jgi:hypothetical protein